LNVAPTIRASDVTRGALRMQTTYLLAIRRFLFHI